MKTARISARISEELANALQKRADEENRTFSNLVESILKKEMVSAEKAKKKKLRKTEVYYEY